MGFVVSACGGNQADGLPTEAPVQETAVSPTSEPIEEEMNEEMGEEMDEPADDETPTSMMETLELEIKGFLFRPETVTIAAGTAVEWTNLDDIRHSVTSGVPDEPSGVFDSDFFVQNEQFSYTFEEPGEYPFFCKRHPHMQATIIVE